MKKYLLSFLLLAFLSALHSLPATSSNAQRITSNAKWTLDSCIDYALTHNVEIRQRLNAARQGELAVKEAKDRVLPNLSGYGSENFSFGRGLTADNTYANRNTSSFSVGAQLSLPLFQGLRVVRSVKYSETNLKALVEQSEATKDDVTINVMAAFLQALYSREALGVARMSLGVSQDELRRREILLEAGKIPELDLFEARAQVSRDELTVVNARNDSVMAILDLANLLNIENDGSFDISPLQDCDLRMPSLDEVWTNMQMANHALRAAAIRRQAAGESVEVAKSGYLPTLSFNAGLGTNYYKTSGFTNEGFAAQMRHNFSKSLGFSLNIPIFDGFSTRNSVSRAKLEQLNSELDLENTRQQLYKTVSTAHAQAIAAEAKEKAAQAAVENTKAAFDAMTVKYDNGRANATEYEKAKTDYINAVSDRLQASYERQLRVRILRHYNEN
ncbi:MAG: TolC family protein [Muribaculaceae bacterium]|nr:TolC family protein [Muribaculaceae bacterium]